jgi:cytochrome c oxidase subunit 2
VRPEVAATNDTARVWAMMQGNGWGKRWRSDALKALALAMGLVAPALALAQQAAEPAAPKPWQLNMGQGVTTSSQAAYQTHMLAFWVCVVIGVVVFGAMIVAMVKFRKSKGAVAAQFSHNTRAEIIWTVIPVIILVAMAIPATQKLIATRDTRSNTEMTVKITGYQWMWKYEYMGEGVEFTSKLARESNELRQSGAVIKREEHPNYLLEVDNPLVLPVNTKVRFVLTSNDVIHSWWVPALGWKQDANPGAISDAWTEILTPGTYRGVCAELCGKDHGFMPIVVQAVSKEEFRQWLESKKAVAPAQPDAVAADAAPATTTPAAG